MNTTKSPKSQPKSPVQIEDVLNDPPPLTPLESLLLAQAVWELGADDWPAVSKVLCKHPLLSRQKSFFTPQSCHAMYVYLMKQANLDCTEANDAIHAPLNLKLAQRHYQARVEELRQLIATEESNFKTIAAEIQEIRQGLWDEKIQVQPVVTDVPPASVSEVPEAMEQVESDQDPERPPETSPVVVIENVASPGEPVGVETVIEMRQKDDEEKDESDDMDEETDLEETPDKLEIPSTAEVFDGSDLSGVTDTGSPPSLSPNEVEPGSVEDDHPSSSLSFEGKVADEPRIPEPIEPMPEEPTTPSTRPEAVSPMDIDEEEVEMEMPTDEPQEQEEEEEEAAPSDRPSTEPEGATAPTSPVDVETSSPQAGTGENELQLHATPPAQPSQEEAELVPEPASSEMEVEGETTRDASIERVQQELQGHSHPAASSPPPSTLSTLPPPTSASPVPAASDSVEAPKEDGSADVGNEDDITSEEEPLQQTRRATRHRPSITPSAPPGRIRGRGRKAKESRANTETSLAEPSPEVDVIAISPKVEEEDQIPSPAPALEAIAVSTRRRDGKRKVENTDSPRDKKRARDESEPVDEEEAGPSTSVPRPRKRDRTEEQVALKRFQNVIGMLHSQISQHRNGNIFHNPIRNSEAPDYHEIVKRPMDLKTIKVKVKDGVIANSLEYQRDIFLMFANAMMYNRPGSDVYVMAEDMMLESEDYIKSFRQTEGLVRGAHRV
ncbi:hypothetical protein BDN72DRAFT_831308 [Pluteus cervinus]|uniref:Uncharacterized protein n=1 Tax=Pluteus cervinus TaxID=181527 RepID=A0ACD3BE00_9AGAR|nr:hypothetical protein BDN72DRAFT_831308 [Pluteus cervinus]